MSDTGAALAKLALDFTKLAQVTSAIGWDHDDDEPIGDVAKLGKPIPKDKWNRAFLVALAMSKQIPRMDLPVPGADPEGFIWLTWSSRDQRRGLALEVHDGKYKWTARDTEGKRTIESDSLNDVAEALRSVFRDCLVP